MPDPHQQPVAETVRNVARPVNSSETAGVAGLGADLSLPLVVDLDGTLVRTDTLHESLLLALTRHPLRLLCMAPATLGNRAVFKRRLLALARPNPRLLPFDPRVLDLLRHEAQRGRQLVLATGADEAIARDVATYLGFFSAAHGSDGSTNLTGRKKAALMDDELGQARWLYAGNSRRDLEVWPASAGAVVVNGSRSLANAVGNSRVPLYGELPRQNADAKTWLGFLRLHQWSKNLLVFAPMVLAHRLDSGDIWACELLGFVAFGLAASGTYVLNDLLDLEADRRHANKQHRPLASGKIGITAAVTAVLMLALVAIAAALPLPAAARWTLFTYAVVTTAYSMRLKTLLSLDVVTLALCYVLRLIFGGFAAGIPLSMWTLSAGIFFFTSLAFAKRLIELRNLPATEEAGLARKRRAYHTGDLIQVGAQAAASGFISIFVVALYINSPDVRLLYSRPDWLWLLCPVLIWWMSRTLILAGRATIGHDPISFALKDRASWVALGLLSAILLVAK